MYIVFSFQKYSSLLDLKEKVKIHPQNVYYIRGKIFDCFGGITQQSTEAPFNGELALPL